MAEKDLIGVWERGEAQDESRWFYCEFVEGGILVRFVVRLVCKIIYIYPDYIFSGISRQFLYQL